MNIMMVMINLIFDHHDDHDNTVHFPATERA